MFLSRVSNREGTYLYLYGHVDDIYCSLSLTFPQHQHQGPFLHIISISTTMRFATISTALALLAAGVSALDKPLNIEVQHSAECERKTTRGKLP